MDATGVISTILILSNWDYLAHKTKHPLLGDLATVCHVCNVGKDLVCSKSVRSYVGFYLCKDSSYVFSITAVYS